MRKLMTLLAGLALALAVFLPGNAQSAVGGTDLPFNVSGAGQGTINLVTGAGQVTWSGYATHLGFFHADETDQLIPTGLTTFTVSADLTVRAANGDLLFGHGTGTGTRGTTGSTTTVHTVYSDGTGRFAGASAYYDATVHSAVIALNGPIATIAVDAVGVGRLSWR